MYISCFRFEVLLNKEIRMSMMDLSYEWTKICVVKHLQMKHQNKKNHNKRDQESLTCWKQNVGNTYPLWNWWMSSFPPTKTCPSSFNFKAFSRSRIFLGEMVLLGESEEFTKKKWALSQSRNIWCEYHIYIYICMHKYHVDHIYR